MLITGSRTPQYVVYMYVIESVSYDLINYYVIPENQILS